MRFKATVLFAVLLAVFISGCTDGGGGTGGTTTIKATEIIILENLEAVPNEVKPERNFVLGGFVTNNAENKMENVVVELSDYCSTVFNVTKTSCSLASYDSYSSCTFSLNLGASKKFQWNFKAPPADRTAGRNFQCNIMVKTKYLYVSHGSVGISLANDAEIAVRETPSSSVTNDGPIKIYIIVESVQPVGKDSVFDVKIVLKNEGAGELDGDGIPGAGFKYNIPEGLSGNCDIPEKIEISKTTKESDPIYCTIETPDILPLKITKHMTAETYYSYKFTRTIPIELIVAE